MSVQWLRSLVFVGQMYLMMPLMGLVFAPWAIVSAKGARVACKTYCHWVFWTARWMVGLRCEVLGAPPKGAVLVAAKHQSFLDIMMLFAALPEAKFIMKRELMWAPVIGIYALRLGCVPVHRGKKGAAIAKMLADVAAGQARPGQLVIYPQGTRVAPGMHKPYKAGTAALYAQMEQPCVPVATNVGVFWPRRGILRKSGLAKIVFLPPMPDGLGKDAFLEQLEAVIETRSDALMQEAGFDGDR